MEPLLASGALPLEIAMTTRVVFLLEGTGLYGGVKVVLQQAELLAREGFSVTIVAKEPRPTWFALSVEFRQVPSFSPIFVPTAELTVATLWTTIEPALRVPWGRKVHYCQGFEAIYACDEATREAVCRSYARSIPAWVVTPFLGNLLQDEFNRPSFLLPPPLDPAFRPSLLKRAPRKMPKILVMGPFEFPWKGIRTALQALLFMRRQGFRYELWRISPSPLTEEERQLVEPDRYFVGLYPKQVARVMRKCDLLLASSWEEGFGLPLLEAMASGLPAVASNIPAFEFLTRGSVPLVPPRDPEALARAAYELLTSPSRWQAVRRASLQRAQHFAVPKAADRVVSAVRWALGDYSGESGDGVWDPAVCLGTRE